MKEIQSLNRSVTLKIFSSYYRLLKIKVMKICWLLHKMGQLVDNMENKARIFKKYCEIMFYSRFQFC